MTRTKPNSIDWLSRLCADALGTRTCLASFCSASALLSLRLVDSTLYSLLRPCFVRATFCQRVVAALRQALGHANADSFCDLLRQSDAELSGSFLLAALEGSFTFQDVDVYQPFQDARDFSPLEVWLWKQSGGNLQIQEYDSDYSDNRMIYIERTYKLPGILSIQVLSCCVEIKPASVIADSDLDFLKNKFNGRRLVIGDVGSLRDRTSVYTRVTHHEFLSTRHLPWESCAVEVLQFRMHRANCHVGRVLKYAARGFAIQGMVIMDQCHSDVRHGDFRVLTILMHEEVFHHLVNHQVLVDEFSKQFSVQTFTVEKFGLFIAIDTCRYILKKKNQVSPDLREKLAFLLSLQFKV